VSEERHEPYSQQEPPHAERPQRPTTYCRRYRRSPWSPPLSCSPTTSHLTTRSRWTTSRITTPPRTPAAPDRAPAPQPRAWDGRAVGGHEPAHRAGSGRRLGVGAAPLFAHAAIVDLADPGPAGRCLASRDERDHGSICTSIAARLAFSARPRTRVSRRSRGTAPASSTRILRTSMQRADRAFADAELGNRVAIAVGARTGTWRMPPQPTLRAFEDAPYPSPPRRRRRRNGGPPGLACGVRARLFYFASRSLEDVPPGGGARTACLECIVIDQGEWSAYPWRVGR
jgi:hypothetical protein